MSDEFPTSHKFTSQRLQLNYVDWGNADAPDLLLIHGGRDHARNWDWVAKELRDDYHIIALDNRGHGDSEWANTGPYGIDEFVYDIAELIDQHDLAPLTIIGHSLGGILSLRYTGIFPENVTKLVSIEGMGLGRRLYKGDVNAPAAERYRKWIADLKKMTRWDERRYDTIEDAAKHMAEANAHLSPEQVHHLTRHGSKTNEDGSISWKFDHYFYSRFIAPTGLDPDEVREIWSSITCPTLIIHGTESWNKDPAEDGSLEFFQNAQSVMVEGAGHWVHHDKFDEFMGLVKPFLAG